HFHARYRTGRSPGARRRGPGERAPHDPVAPGSEAEAPDRAALVGDAAPPAQAGARVPFSSPVAPVSIPRGGSAAGRLGARAAARGPGPRGRADGPPRWTPGGATPPGGAAPSGCERSSLGPAQARAPQGGDDAVPRTEPARAAPIAGVDGAGRPADGDRSLHD